MAQPGAAGRRPIRVLVVDDTVVVRRMVGQVLDGQPDIEVAATAMNGRFALQKLESTEVDVVVLDVEMPVMDGITTVKEIRRRWQKLPIIMFSTLTDAGAAVTLEALSLGANDYLTKPSTLAGGNALEQTSLLLAETVRFWGRQYQDMQRPDTSMAGPPAPASPAAHARPGISRPPAHTNASRTLSAGGRAAPTGAQPAGVGAGPLASSNSSFTLATPRTGPIDVVVIGISTGGPNALAEVLPKLPSNLAVPVIIVQHMPPVFTRLLAERLDARSPLTVVESLDGQDVVAGTVYLAPGGRHLTVRRNGVRILTSLNDGAPENSCRPAVDVMFRGASSVWGANVLAVVMTGMGQDGMKGSEVIRAAGGRVVVQDERSSVVWGMPGFVARAGSAEEVVPLQEIAEAILQRVNSGRRVPALAGGHR